jgi:hypothetical protein
MQEGSLNTFGHMPWCLQGPSAPLGPGATDSSSDWEADVPEWPLLLKDPCTPC